MCFYDQHCFSCGDWEWAHFRQDCIRESRPGEICGLKLVMQTVPIGAKCHICDQIDAKQQCRATEEERISQWQQDAIVMEASINSSYDKIKDLDWDIYDLSLQRQRESQSLRRVVTETRIADCYSDCQLFHKGLGIDGSAQVEFQRGRQIDMANLVARASREKEKEGGVGRKLGPVSIAFETVRGEFFFLFSCFFVLCGDGIRAWNECGDACANFNWGVDREDFAAALGGKDAEVGVTGMEDLIGFS